MLTRARPQSCAVSLPPGSIARSGIAVVRVGGRATQDIHAKRPGATFLISFRPFAVVWNQTLTLL